MITSCSPGWINFMEKFYPELIPHASTCRSPMSMFSVLVKTYYAEKTGIDPKKIFMVAVMPCVAKKYEAGRPEHSACADGTPYTDAVLTTRELIWMIKCYGIDFATLPQGEFDAPLGMASGAGDIFGTTGGVMEATLRAASELVTGKPADRLEFTEVRAVEGLRETYVAIGEQNIHVGVANGLTNAKILLDKVKAGKEQFHVIEVMACPGGCSRRRRAALSARGRQSARSRVAPAAGRRSVLDRQQEEAPQIVREPGDRGSLQFVPGRAGHGKGPRTAAHPLSRQRAARSPMSTCTAPTIGNKWRPPPSWCWASRSRRSSTSAAASRIRESQLIAVLHKVQAQFGYLGDAHFDAVAQLLQVPAAKVAGVASFYHFFRLKPRGKFMINVCLGTACYVKGADRVAQKVIEELGITWGETSKDGVFTLEALPLPRHLRPGPGRDDRRRGPRRRHARPGAGAAGEVSEEGEGAESAVGCGNSTRQRQKSVKSERSDSVLANLYVTHLARVEGIVRRLVERRFETADDLWQFQQDTIEHQVEIQGTMLRLRGEVDATTNGDIVASV